VSSLRIVSVHRELVADPSVHWHVSAIGIGAHPDRIDRWLTLPDALDAIDGGDHFYTIGDTSKMLARVHRSVCPLCLHHVIGSTSENVPDNNLHNLPSK